MFDQDGMELIQMGRIIKHLEKILVYIEQEEYEEVDDHVDDMEELPAHPKVAHIIMLLNLGLYQAAVEPIRMFIKEFKIMASRYLEQRSMFFWRVRK